MKKRQIITFVFSIAFSINICFSQSYNLYEDSNNMSELSFEAMITYHEHGLNVLKPSFSSILGMNVDLFTIQKAISFHNEISNQINFLHSHNYSGDQIRICNDQFNNLSYQEQEQHKAIISHIELHYSITTDDFNDLISIIQDAINNSTGKLNSDFLLLEEYITLAYNQKYTVLEIFRDFTGYWNPETIVSTMTISQILNQLPGLNNYTSIYRYPFNYTSKTEKHGLKAEQAIQRLIDIVNCEPSILRENSNSLSSENVNILSLNDCQIAVNISESYLTNISNNNHQVRIHDLSGKLILNQTINSIKTNLDLEYPQGLLVVSVLDGYNNVLKSQLVICLN